MELQPFRFQERTQGIGIAMYGCGTFSHLNQKLSVFRNTRSSIGRKTIVGTSRTAKRRVEIVATKRSRVTRKEEVKKRK